MRTPQNLEIQNITLVPGKDSEAVCVEKGSSGSGGQQSETERFLISKLSYYLPTESKDVTFHKELWEEDGNTHSHNSKRVMGMGKEPGIFV